MSIELTILLLGLLHNISNAAGIIIVICIITTLLLFMASDMSYNGDEKLKYNKLMKVSISVFIIALIIATLIPDTGYLLAASGVHFGKDTVLVNKSIKLLESKIDDQLKGE